MTESETVQTKLGPVQVFVHPEYLYITFGGDGTFSVHGIAQEGTLRLGRTDGAPDGAWDLYRERSDPNGYHALFVKSRWTGTKFVDASSAARETIKREVIPAVAAWIDANPKILAQAAYRAVIRDIEKTELLIADLQERLAQQEEKLAHLKAAVA